MKIGFLEYQLTNSHFKKFHSLLTGELGKGEVSIVAVDELSSTDEGRQWAAANNVRYCDTPQEVVAQSDALLVLAPNNPEKHLEVAVPALTSGKPVFIDKMLAASPDHAEEIILLAKKSNTPLMSSSSLRFAVELEEFEKRLKGEPEEIFVRGYGKFPIYAVHSIALLMRYFGPDVKQVIDTGSESARVVTVDNGTRRALLEVRDSKNGARVNPWQIGVLSGGRYETATVKDTEGFYRNLMSHALEFFRTGKSPLSTEEQLAVVQVQSAAEQSFKDGGRWVEVKPSERAKG